MKRFFLLFSLLILGSGAFADHVTANLFLSSRLTGDQEVPAVTTQALGLASYVFNSDRTELRVRAHMVGLSGPITGAHLHQAPRGVSGPVVFDLMPGLSGNVINFVVTGITRQQLAIFLKEGFYLNVHTAANPNGEIRGQVMPETDYSFVAELTGTEEVPAVTTQARGLAIVNLSLDRSTVEFFGVTTGLKIGGVHLHMAGRGANGPVVVDLVPFKVGDTYVRGRAPATRGLISAMMNDSIYMNVHTAAHPNGEIRGQLMHKPGYLYFDARLMGSEQVPPVATAAVGLTVMTLAPTMDSLWVQGLIGDSLSSMVMGSHIHSGERGASGPVVVDLEPFRNGQVHSGRITGAALTNDLLNSMMAAGNYVNIHTMDFPNGEIRGQVYKTAREGFTFFLDGSQQVPPVTTPGAGLAVASYDRDMTSLHYMVNWAGLSGAATGAHFHLGSPGETGPVVFDLMPTVMNGNTTAGYWNQSSGTPFNAVSARRLRRDSMYVNVHTAANPNGEVRGQVMRAVVAVRPVLPRNAAMVLAPNPTAATLLANGIDEEASLTLRSSTGAVVLEARIRPGSRIQAGSLPPGLYHYQIKTRTAQNAGKLVKE